MRKGHAYQHLMGESYECCRRCGHVSTNAVDPDGTTLEPALPFRYQVMLDAARGHSGRP
ncbi:MAG: hypothetical protein ACRDLE_07755 [Gaiellaceae bacterium]